MKESSTITDKTEIVPSDIIRNSKGKMYRVDTYHNSKTSYKIVPWPSKPGEENPGYVVIEKSTLVSKQWEKLDKSKIKLSEPEPVAAAVEENEEMAVEGDEAVKKKAKSEDGEELDDDELDDEDEDEDEDEEEAFEDEEKDDEDF
ncbi:MAG: hypothetical protein ACK40G_00540 [Cytophagaceae bacterium]